MTDLEQRVIAAVSAEAGKPCDLSTSLDDLGLDSLDRVNLFLALQLSLYACSMLHRNMINTVRDIVVALQVEEAIKAENAKLLKSTSVTEMIQ